MTEKDDRIEHLENDLRMCVQEKDKQIAELVQRIAELESEIDELEELRTEQWREIMCQAKRIAELESKAEGWKKAYNDYYFMLKEKER